MSSVASSLTSGVVSIYSTNGAFAALKTDGSVVTWGYMQTGGIQSIYDPFTSPFYTSVASRLTSGVLSIYSTEYASAALKNDGSVVSWGYSTFGGDSDYPNSNGTSLNSGVVALYSNLNAFAALKNDGSVITWGDSSQGGNSNYPYSNVNKLNTGVVAIYNTNSAFAALKSDGSVVTWGHTSWGGDTNYPVSNGTSLNSGVVSVYGNTAAFAAVKSDGRVITWGDPGYGGGSSIYYPYPDDFYTSVASSLTSGVIGISTTHSAFAALKTTETTFDLSGSHYTDIDRYDILRNKEARRRVNLNTLNNNVFRLTQAKDLQKMNRNIPPGRILKIIVPNYETSLAFFKIVNL